MILSNALSADEDIRFKYHIDVLELFGKHLKAHIQATYRLDDDWLIWFPKLYRNRDFINEYADETIEMKQLGTSIIVSKKIFPDDEPGNRIIFAHIIDPITGEKYYKFIGTFTELVGQMNYAKSKRTGKEIYYDNKGRFSTKPF